LFHYLEEVAVVEGLLMTLLLMIELVEEEQEEEVQS